MLSIFVASSVTAPQMSAQITWGSPAELSSDNDANQGSPFILNFNNNLYSYYVNHSNNQLYVDENLGVYQYNIGRTVGTQEITDVQAAEFNGKVYLWYDDQYGGLTLLSSSDGLNFSTVTVQGSYGFPAGVGGYQAVIPSLTVYNGKLWTAIVGTDRKVYVASSSDGVTFAPPSSSPPTQQLSSSRPSLAVFNSNLYLGFVYSTGNGVAYVGPLFSGSTYSPRIAAVPGSWANSNRDTNYAGIALQAYQGSLWVFGQSFSSNHYLYEMYTTDGSNYSTPSAVKVNNNNVQLRWTPSAAVNGSGVLYLEFQGNGNTNIYYMNN
jgi:hypothetical protein